jgi:hypothetical protein
MEIGSKSVELISAEESDIIRPRVALTDCVRDTAFSITRGICEELSYFRKLR